jgi:RNA polymerase sigma factor for flagellar operon FliA
MIPAESADPEEQVEHAEFMDGLAAAIEALPEREALVVSLYYVEEMNLKEIAAVIEVSESRVSQILTACVKKLRSCLQDSL